MISSCLYYSFKISVSLSIDKTLSSFRASSSLLADKTLSSFRASSSLLAFQRIVIV